MQNIVGSRAIYVGLTSKYVFPNKKNVIVCIIERCLAAVTAAPWISGSSCVEASVVSVRSVVCAHFVSDNFWQILADS